jgi:hypothetical protein
MNQQTVTLRPSATETLQLLRKRFPQSPFLALGQTALWDEPTKATLRRALDGEWQTAHLIAATHDTDYFAKLPNHPSTPEQGKYALVLHDDARTRGLWSAAGEMSQLFGSEDVITREMLEHQAGVTLHRALSQAEDPQFLLSELTVAWGWTGIIYTEWDRKVVRDIPLADILPTLLEQMDTAMQGSADCLSGQRAEAARTLTATVRNGVVEFAKQNITASLADLYEYLLPQFYHLLLRHEPKNLSTSRTSELLRFNTKTAHLPRFAFAHLFIDPQTRHDAIAAYDLAVSGSDIYTLDQFGEGALPFDVVVPHRGRGTLHLPDSGAVIIDLPQNPILLRDTSPIRDIVALARLLERELGEDIALVGKAITLLPMLTAEHILVFHEGASSYSSRTRDMVVEMKKRGIPVPELRPILRLKYATWDALAAVTPHHDTDVLALPPHFEQGFCLPEISFEDFATCWKHAQHCQKRKLDELAELRSPRLLLEYFARTIGEDWHEDVHNYDKATVSLKEMWERSEILKSEIQTLRDEIYHLKQETVALEQAKGDNFRANIQPLRDQLLEATQEEALRLENEIARLQTERHNQFDTPIEANRERIREAQLTIRERQSLRRTIERSPEIEMVRATLRRIEGKAETEKARITGNSLRVINGLKHTNFRPTAWWFPLVDPSGAWFQRLTETTEYHLEPLDV